MSEVTVIIPNYNGIKFIEECLDSLLAQLEEIAFEVIVVDNGSTDGSLEWLQERFCKDGKVSIIPLGENTGFDRAVNEGIKASGTPFVVLLNNDTRVRPGFVKKLYEAIVSNPKAFSVSAKMLMWDREDLLDDAGDNYCALGWAYARGKGRPEKEYNAPVKIFSACAGAAIYRKAVLEEMGFFDEAHFAYLEDLDVGYRGMLLGYENYYEPTAEVIHYGSASSGSRYNEFKTVLAARNSVYVVLKNMPLLQLIWNLPLLILGFLVKFLFFVRKGMGKLYLKGLAQGCKLGLSREGRKRKLLVPFRFWGRYLYIQWLLYVNLIKFLKKS